MAIAWCNFRASGTSDAAGSVRNLGDVYPFVGQEVAGIYPQGWVVANPNMGDDGTYAADHQRGWGSSTGSVDNATWRISGLTIGHVYRCYMSQGLIFAGNDCGFNIYSANRTGVLYTQLGTTVPAAQFMDINGVVFSNPTTWAAGQGFQDITATTTDFYICKATNNSRMNAFGIEDQTPVGGGAKSQGMLMGMVG